MKKYLPIAVACLLSSSAKIAADDIEIYLNGSTASGDAYVHLMLDYRPSVFNVLCNYGAACAAKFSPGAYAHLTGYSVGDQVSTFAGFVAVMTEVFSDTAYDGIYMALVTPNKSDGGTILKGYKQLGGSYTVGATTLQGRQILINTLSSIPEAKGNDAHKLSPKETYFEWFRYINGLDVLNGTLTSGNFTASGSSAPTPNYDPDIITNSGGGAFGRGTYISPFVNAGACSKLYSMLIAMNAENQDDDWNTTSPSGNGITDLMSPLAASKKFVNMLTWLHKSDTDVLPSSNTINAPLEKTWVISDSGSQGQTPSWAKAGGTSLLNLDDPAQLEKDLGNAFKEIISVSSTFVAASVPVNVFNQAKALDNVFVALFEAQSTTSWPGNIKKLKLADTYDPNDPNNPAGRDGLVDEIVDVNGDPGFESKGANKGRITFDALTFWSDVGTLPPPDPNQPDPNNPVYVPAGVDGRVVSRGGAGQKIDGFVGYDDYGAGAVQFFIGDTNTDTPVGGYSARQLYVEPASITNGSSNTFAAFNADNTTATNLKALLDPTTTLTNAAAIDLIKWGRGQDADNNSAAARGWILADAIHSRPFALNYGATSGYSKANPNIRIFMGTGDGLFHMIENTDTAGNETGRELFAFYPREVLGNIRLNRQNTISSLQKRYGVDGEAVVLTKDRNSDGTLDVSDGDEAYVYVGMRRGGNSYYALDVSDPSAVPTIKWKIDPSTPGFSELGLTFSTPIVGKVRYDGAAVDVLVFAGGYNGGWDAAYTARVGKDLNASDDTVGNAIYIVNARTGALIWKAVNGSMGASTNTQYAHSGLVDSIPSGVTVLQNLTGNIHRIYVGDTGGAVWRVDLPEGDGSDANHRRDKWFITKLAELGTDGATTDRRFFHAPEVVETFDDGGNLDGVIIQSGNRADPNDTSVENYLFYIKDRLTASGSVSVQANDPNERFALADLADQTLCVTGLEGAGSCAATIPNGWAIKFGRAGEKGLSSPLLDAGRVFSTTFRPGAAGTCAPSEGEGSVYVVNLADGTAEANNERIYDIGPGIPPGAILVGDMILIPGGGIDIYDEDGDGVRDQTKLTKSLTKKLYQIYWREPGVDKL